MICPDCGSNEPRNAKYCGLCGAPLTQEGRVKHFLKGSEDDWEIELPGSRRPAFYVVVTLAAVFLALALAALGFLAFRLLTDDSQPAETGPAVEDNSARFTDEEFGVSFLYPRLWEEQEQQEGGKLLSVKIGDSAARYAVFSVSRLPPEVSVGGAAGIQTYVSNSLDKELALSPSPSGQPAGTAKPGIEDVSVNGQPALWTEYERMEGGEEITYQRYWLAPSELLFEFKFRAPSEEWRAVAVDFSLMVQSFRASEEAP